MGAGGGGVGEAVSHLKVSDEDLNLIPGAFPCENERGLPASLIF